MDTEGFHTALRLIIGGKTRGVAYAMKAKELIATGCR